MLYQKEPKKIQLLPEHIVDQIKAGEVIERPSTLLKELLENSVDAQAKNISVEILGAGMDLIVVKDDGVGMHDEDIELAFTRHATSKIEKFEDLYKLNSYGFRGEALASMASISKVLCVTNKKNSPESTLKMNGPLVESLTKDETRQKKSKTHIYIKDLFYNTPARLKFVKSQTTEKNQLSKIITAFLLTHHKINFTIKWDDKPKKIYKSESHLNRIKSVASKNFKTPEFLVSENCYEDLHSKIFLATSTSKSYSNKFQYLFVNGRLITNIQLHKIILNTAAPLWGHKASGHYCLFLNIPSDQIDVNVHPNKTVVKFFETHKVFSLVSESVKKILSSNSTLPENKEQEKQIISVPQLDHNQSEPLTSLSEKNLSYNTKDIKDETDLENYFSRLDGHSPQLLPESSLESSTRGFQSESKWTLIKKFTKISLYLHASHIYKVDWPLTTFTHAKYHLLNKTSDAIPLLIGRPLSVTCLKRALLEELTSVGLEVDQLEENVLIIRSFPKALKNLDYEKLLLEIIKTNSSTLDEAMQKLDRDKVDFTSTGSESLLQELSQGDQLFEELKLSKAISLIDESKLQSL